MYLQKSLAAPCPDTSTQPLKYPSLPMSVMSYRRGRITVPAQVVRGSSGGRKIHVWDMSGISKVSIERFSKTKSPFRFHQATLICYDCIKL